MQTKNKYNVSKSLWKKFNENQREMYNKILDNSYNIAMRNEPHRPFDKAIIEFENMIIHNCACTAAWLAKELYEINPKENE